MSDCGDETEDESDDGDETEDESDDGDETEDESDEVVGGDVAPASVGVGVGVESS